MKGKTLSGELSYARTTLINVPFCYLLFLVFSSRVLSRMYCIAAAFPFSFIYIQENQSESSYQGTDIS